ncbi:MAG: amino acid ABC transporter permease [Oscillospiraceae bacterium]|nr:amino acid ABC transporter permease [Oscillospiraceae bacterium]
MTDLQGSLQIITTPSVLVYIFKGVAFTLVISVLAVVISLVFGSLLAMLRNYCTSPKTRIFKWLSTAYIEIFRNTPLLLWIFIGVVFIPTPGIFNSKMFGLSSVEVGLMFKACVALVLFTSSVVAEIVRGGLNSVAQGQFEAGHSQGFSIVQVMIYIVLPQAYRAIIPTLLSQVITTIKDSSYLANVAVIELMSRVRRIMNAAGNYNGLGTVNVSDVFILFGLAALIYFIINFALSCVVRYMQKRTRQSNRPVVQTEMTEAVESA